MNDNEKSNIKLNGNAIDGFNVSWQEKKHFQYGIFIQVLLRRTTKNEYTQTHRIAKHGKAIHKWINHKPPVNKWEKETNKSMENHEAKCLYIWIYRSLEFCNTAFFPSLQFFNYIVPFFAAFIPFVRFIFFFRFSLHCLLIFFSFINNKWFPFILKSKTSNRARCLLWTVRWRW